MKKKIRILVDEQHPFAKDTVAEAKAARPSLETLIRSTGGKVIEVEANTLAKEMSSAYSLIIEALSCLPSMEGIFKIQTVSFTLAIDSTGGVSLLSALSGSVKTQVGLTFIVSLSGDKSNVTVSKKA